MEENRKPRLEDFWGLKEDISKKVKFAIDQLKNPWACKKVGLSLRCILLYGLPGTGKTMLARVIASEAGVPFYVIQSATGLSVESGESMTGIFLKAHQHAASVILLDTIDCIEPAIESELKTILDGHGAPAYEEGFVLVIGATDRLEAISDDLSRRFLDNILLGVPDHVARADILSVLTRDQELSDCFDRHAIAKSAHGFVGADLKALVDMAKLNACTRAITLATLEELHEDEGRQQLEQLRITMADFEKAVENIQPSLNKQAFYAIPKTKWEDIGGHDSLRQAFSRYIVKKIKHPELFEKLKLELETGFMLFGPPGCGKSLIVQAVANEAGANFFHVKCRELLRKFAEESELVVHALFSQARACTPCILFFDEIDVLVGKRKIAKRLYNKLTEQLDRSNRQGVFVIGSTHRIEVLNSTLTDRGRFRKICYVRLLSKEDRASILEVPSRRKPLNPNVDLNSIAQMEACQNLSGADQYKLMNENAMGAMDDVLTGTTSSSSQVGIKRRHFEYTRSNISASLSEEDIQSYESAWEKIKWRRRLLI